VGLQDKTANDEYVTQETREFLREKRNKAAVETLAVDVLIGLRAMVWHDSMIGRSRNHLQELVKSVLRGAARSKARKDMVDSDQGWRPAKAGNQNNSCS
jgi:hypothetical protein